MLRVESKQGERNIPWHLKLLPGEQGNNFGVGEGVAWEGIDEG